jgi:hypothetical protein
MTSKLPYVTLKVFIVSTLRALMAYNMGGQILPLVKLAKIFFLNPLALMNDLWS